MGWLVVSLTVGGGVALAMFLMRRRVAKKWGLFKSDKKLNGQVVIVTGANTGLGAETARDLALRGATLILACRSWDRTRPLLAQLRKETGNQDVHFSHLDLASLASVKEFAQDFLQNYDRLDTLVCNAGVWVPPPDDRKTVDGFEIHAGVNHLGHFYLTHLLQDMLQKTAGSRVVVVSSSLMRQGRFDPEQYDHFKAGRQPDPDKKKSGFSPPIGYCDSKLMNALFVKKLAERTGPQLTSVACCPGFCKTELGRFVQISFIKKILFLPIMVLIMRSAKRGAHNIIHGAVEDTDKLVNGGFYRECKLSVEDQDRLNGMEEACTKLWQISEQLCKVQSE